MHANIRLIAQEEVEIEALKRDIAEAQDNLADQRQAISSLRDTLAVQQASYTLGGREYGRTEVAEELGRRFERFKEAELVLAGKQRLLSAREKSLRGALEMLNRTRSQKLLMEQKIESLEAQHRLVKAAGRGSGVGVDTGKLAQADKLIQQIHKRLDVAERVLAHEAKFVEHIPVETTDATDVVAQVDEYFQADAPREDIAAAKVAPQVESVPATETP
jgi:flagellar biosynthesis chaperone FliJ